MSVYLIITAIFVFVVLEGFFSGSETAIISCDKMRLRHLARSGENSARIIESLLARPDRLLSTTLVGTNLAVIISSTLMAGFMVSKLGGASGSLMAALIMTPLILIFGEIIPKTVFRQHADFLIKIIAYPLLFFYYLLFPFILAALLVTNLILAALGERKIKKTTFFSKEEITTFIEERSKKEIMGPEKMKIIRRIFHFGEKPVISIMVPFEKTETIPAQVSVEEALKIAGNFKFSRFPVYENRKENIIGVLEIKDLLAAGKDEKLMGYLKTLEVVPAYKKIEELLDDFIKEKNHLALVVNEKAEVLGLVTLEDLIEEIIGEIKDEFDK